MKREPTATTVALSRRTMLLSLALLTLFCGATCAGVRWFYHTSTPWVMRWRTQSYLKDKADHKDFRINFPLPSKAEMKAKEPARQAPAEPAKGQRTSRDFATLRTEYLTLQREIIVTRRAQAVTEKAIDQLRSQLNPADTNSTRTGTNKSTPVKRGGLANRAAVLEKEMASRKQLLAEKEKELEPVLADLRDFQRAFAARPPVMDLTELTAAQGEFNRRWREDLEGAQTYETVYRAIGQQLWVAKQLLGSRNNDHQQVGLRMARQAVRDALFYAEDPWLATSICRGYLWPNLAAAEGRGGSPVVELLDECGDVFRRAEYWEGLRENYELLLSKAQTPKQADLARVRLSLACEQAGQYAEAIQHLKSVRSTNDFAGVMRRLSRLEQRASP